MKTKNDTAWEKLFDTYSINEAIGENGFYEITAGLINPLRESRLMTKFDHKSNLPEIFKKNDLSILPTKRGTYLIGSFNAYNDVCYKEQKIKQISFPPQIESIDLNNIYSEADDKFITICAGLWNFHLQPA